MDINKDIIQRYRQTHGVHANKVFSILGQNQQLINALTSTIGQELMKEVLELAESELNELLTMKIDESKEKFAEQRAMYKCSMKLIERYMNKLDTTEKLTNKVKENKK